ncbi:MAG: hypothetical protein ACRD4Q_00800 [Candidatus Acidiferrales bacterium]
MQRWKDAARRSRRSLSEWLRIAAEQAVAGGAGRMCDGGTALGPAEKRALKALRALYRQDPRKWEEKLADLCQETRSKMPHGLHESVTRPSPSEAAFDAPGARASRRDG